jgi:hypothetical protein
LSHPTCPPFIFLNNKYKKLPYFDYIYGAAKSVVQGRFLMGSVRYFKFDHCYGKPNTFSVTHIVVYLKKSKNIAEVFKLIR